jgi:hypothetical protein
MTTLTMNTEDPENSNPSKWHAIAKHVPNRTNKDCRKRWFAKMASDVVKGGWAPDEDEKLVKGIERYGTRYVYPFNKKTSSLTYWVLLRWSLVASVVQTRNSDRMWPFVAVFVNLTQSTQNVLNVGLIHSTLLLIGLHGPLKL